MPRLSGRANGLMTSNDSNRSVCLSASRFSGSYRKRERKPEIPVPPLLDAASPEMFHLEIWGSRLRVLGLWSRKALGLRIEVLGSRFKLK